MYSGFVLIIFGIVATMGYFLPHVIKSPHNIIIENIGCGLLIAFVIVITIVAVIWGLILIEDTMREAKMYDELVTEEMEQNGRTLVRENKGLLIN